MKKKPIVIGPRTEPGYPEGWSTERMANYMEMPEKKAYLSRPEYAKYLAARRVYNRKTGKVRPAISKIEVTPKPLPSKTRIIREQEIKSKSEPPIGKIHEVTLQSTKGAIIFRMTDEQLTTIKGDIAKSHKTKIPARYNNIPIAKIIDEKIIRSNERGFILIGESLDKIDDFRKKFLRAFDIEAQYAQMGAPNTGLTVKTYLSKKTAGEEKGLKAVQGLEKFQLKRSDFNLLAFAAEDVSKLSPNARERLRPAINYIREFFDKYFKILKRVAPEWFKFPWPQSKVQRNFEEISHLKESIKRTAQGRMPKALKEARIKKLKLRIKELHSENLFFKKHRIKFMHLPIRLWLGDLFEKNPTKARQLITATFRGIRGRETPTLADFVQTGLIDRDDVDVRDIMAFYSRYVEDQLAQLDIINAAKKEGMVKLIGEPGTEGWVSLPIRIAPALKGYRAHPGFAEALESHFNNLRTERGSIGRLMAAVKMMQFYNPLILPMYDFFQAALAGTFNIDMPTYMGQAINDVRNKTDNYWEAYERGLFSTPFANPFENFQKQLAAIKRHQDNAGNYAMDALSKMKEYAKGHPLLLPIKIPGRIIGDMYNVSWHMAWGTDKVVRMTTYNYLKERGLSNIEAAQVAAKFHGDYASVPPSTRKVLNKIFFTPTFEMAMNKMYIEMIRNSAKFALKGGKIGQAGRVYARGILYAGAILFGKHAYLTKGMGFKTDQLCRRYFKHIDTITGPKEAIIVFSNPVNLWIRHYYGVKPDETSPNVFANAGRYGFRKIHPLSKTLIMLGRNKDEKGDYITNWFDSPLRWAIDATLFVVPRIFRITERIEALRDTGEKKEAISKLSEDIGTFQTQVLDKIAFIYTRNMTHQRAIGRINAFSKESAQYLRFDIDKFLRSKDQDKYIADYTRRLMEYYRRLGRAYQKIGE